MRNHELNNLVLMHEYPLLPDCILEDLLGNLELQRWRYDLEKLFQLPLVIQVTLGSREELTHLALDVLGQVHVFHGSVRNVDLLDKALTFSIECLQDDSNGTEHISIEKSTEDQNTGADNVLYLGLRIDIVSTKGQD